MRCIKQEAQEKQYNITSTGVVPSKSVRGIAGLLAHVLTPGQKRQQGLGLEQPTRLEEREETASRNHRVALSRSARVHSHELDWLPCSREM
jgi:hypothetical protein